MSSSLLKYVDVLAAAFNASAVPDPAQIVADKVVRDELVDMTAQERIQFLSFMVCFSAAASDQDLESILDRRFQKDALQDREQHLFNMARLLMDESVTAFDAEEDNLIYPTFRQTRPTLQ